MQTYTITVTAEGYHITNGDGVNVAGPYADTSTAKFILGKYHDAAMHVARSGR